jgi:hypothetical protein
MQLLAVTEEEVLAKWALQYHAWGLPLQIRHLRQFALEILVQKKIHNPIIGKHWHLQFLSRNPSLKVKLSSPIDRKRVAACTPENLQSFFDLLVQIVTENKISKRNIHNMDEKGTFMGCMNREYILVPKEEKIAFISQDGGREWVSSIECISAEGTAIDTFLIVKGVHFREDYFDNANSGMTIATSEKGWTSKEIAMLWLQHHFEPRTRDPEDSQAPRLLIVDGHESHCSIEFIEYCCDHSIFLLILPPHTTHILQPLDKGIFGPLSQAYTQILDRHNRWDGRWIDKASFIEYYNEARKIAFTSANIISAFAATGIVPYNPLLPLGNLRPTTPPTQIAISTQGRDPIIIELQNHNQKTVTQVTELIRKSLTNTPARELETVVQSLFTSNAILCKANSEFINNARKPKGKKRLVTTARWLTKADAEELRNKQLAKDNAERDKKIAATNKKADTAIRKAQEALDKAERFEQQQVNKEFRAEFQRLGKIHKNYYK